MPYERETWVDDDGSGVVGTPFTAARMNNIEAWLSLLPANHKESVRAATTANITIATALNNGDSIDGVSLVTGDRVLVRAQSTPAQNGIYIVGASPARSPDADAVGDLPRGTLVFIESGFLCGGRLATLTGNGVVTPGTTPQNWSLSQKEHLDAGNSPKVELPGSGVLLPGDTCKFWGSKSDGVLWDLFYIGEGEYPWLKVGGPPLRAVDDGERALFNQTSYANLPTDPMSITAPLAGDYDIRVESDIAVGGAAARHGYLSYAVGATAASDVWGVSHNTVSSDVARTVPSRAWHHTGVPAGAVIAEKGRTGGNYTVTWRRRALWVDPIRVG